MIHLTYFKGQINEMIHLILCHFTLDMPGDIFSSYTKFWFQTINKKKHDLLISYMLMILTKAKSQAYELLKKLQFYCFN